MTNVDFGRREMFKFLVAYFFYSDTYSTVASVGILVIQQVYPGQFSIMLNPYSFMINLIRL